MCPINEENAVIISSFITLTSRVSKTSPVASCVLVVTPNFTPATYSLPESIIKSDALVAMPTHTGKTPDASGSNVPV